ncbi:hypothetical protein HCN44_009814 [Aphidius gifuensis]|uniref:Transmembrane protein 177 n=1 Tax=Aphidius gifuensis TaxID=684658 RepID=A0A834Y8I6_APHGI|nr:transmembrane protein 177 [Aphidius gifuensis]KAF7998416.1 hypothetical protein HCN44_009814 [Aphidius gifuensis]
MSKFFAWFATPVGKKFVGIAAVTTTCGVFSAHYFPQTFLLKNYYHDFVTMRKNGNPLPVTPKLTALVNEVFDDLKLDEYKRVIIKPFMVFGFDVWHAGFLSSRFGSLIGLPINFTYTDEKLINKESILINNEPVEWNSEEAKQLIDSLMLSEEAKKYAIAREILMTDNTNVTTQAIVSSLLVGACYGFTSHLNESLKNFQKPQSLRVLFYGIMGTFFWGLWTMQKDAWTRYIEADVDKLLAQLGPVYVKGGHEYYEKLAKRNAALRRLLGGEGQNLYTANGNEVIWLRQKRLPVSYRKQYFGDLLKNYEVTNAQAS